MGQSREKIQQKDIKSKPYMLNLRNGRTVLVAARIASCDSRFKVFVKMLSI